jgi:hypothetical protein
MLHAFLLRPPGRFRFLRRIFFQLTLLGQQCKNRFLVFVRNTFFIGFSVSFAQFPNTGRRQAHIAIRNRKIALRDFIEKI